MLLLQNQSNAALQRYRPGNSPNNFNFRRDLTKVVNGKVYDSLDEVLLDEGIGGFVGMFLFDSVDDI